MGYYTAYSSDGCPNNCEYCMKMGLKCIYSADNPDANINKYKCVICEKPLRLLDIYMFKHLMCCEECHGEIMKLWSKNRV